MPPLDNEDRYFLEIEAKRRAQLRADMEAKARAAAQRQHLARELHGNEQLAQRLHDLGFDAASAPALHLLPLVAVAWADDKVTDRERQTVMQVAEAHGIQPGSDAAVLLASMLESRPKPEVAEQIFSLLHDILAAKGLHPHSLVEACVDVAGASGGFLGLGSKVNADEQALIEKITRVFDAASREKVVHRLE